MRISDWSSDVCSSDLLIGALVLQLVELPDSLSAARPLWMPLMLAYWALREPQLPALVPAFLLGLMLDVLYAAPLGQHALVLVVVVYLVVCLRSFFIIRSDGRRVGTEWVGPFRSWLSPYISKKTN